MSRWVRHQAEIYKNGQERPLGGYLALLGVYGGGVGVLAVAGRLGGYALPERIGVWDTTLLAVATYRLSRTLAKDPVISPLRAPFTTFDGTSGPAELAEQVRGHGMRHSVGELLVCPLCLAQWVATGLGAGLVFVPRQTRLIMAILSAGASADFLQHVYALLQRAAE